MIDPGAIGALVDAGGWTAFVTLVVFIGLGVIRGWWVPGWIYRRLEIRVIKLEAAVAKLTTVVRRLGAKPPDA